MYGWMKGLAMGIIILTYSIPIPNPNPKSSDEDDDLAGGPRGKRQADLADVRHSHPRGVDFFWCVVV